jgi:hypothetical protein
VFHGQGHGFQRDAFQRLQNAFSRAARWHGYRIVRIGLQLDDSDDLLER